MVINLNISSLVTQSFSHMCVMVSLSATFKAGSLSFVAKLQLCSCHYPKSKLNSTYSS